MAFNVQQIDTAAPAGALQACAAQATGAGAVGREATVGGTAGVVAVNSGNQNSGTHLAKVMFEWTPPANVTWAAGTWTIPLNITTGNTNLTIENAYVCRLNSANAVQATIGSATALGIVASAGVKNINVTGATQTPVAGDKVYIVLTVQNASGQMNQQFAWTPDQVIVSPFETNSQVLTQVGSASPVAPAAPRVRQTLALTSNTWTQQTPTYEFYAAMNVDTPRMMPQGFNKTVYSTYTSRFYWLEVYERTGAGATIHRADEANIYGNALWSYDPATGVVRLETVFNWNYAASTTTELPENATNPTPVPRHTYGTIFVDDERQRIGLWLGANARVTPTLSPDHWVQAFWYWDLNNVPGTVGGWTFVDMTHVSYEEQLGAFELTGETDGPGDRYVWFGAIGTGSTQKRQTGILNLATLALEAPLDPNGETAGQSDPDVDQFGMASCFDSLRRKTWFFFGRTDPDFKNDVFSFDHATNTWTRHTTTGTPTARKNPKAAYDSLHDKILVGGGIDAGLNNLTDWYVFDPATLTFTPHNAPGGPPPGDTTTLNLAYSPDYDCFLRYTVSGSTPQFWVLRVEAAQVIEPASAIDASPTGTPTVSVTTAADGPVILIRPVRRRQPRPRRQTRARLLSYVTVDATAIAVTAGLDADVVPAPSLAAVVGLVPVAAYDGDSVSTPTVSPGPVSVTAVTGWDGDVVPAPTVADTTTAVAGPVALTRAVRRRHPRPIRQRRTRLLGYVTDLLAAQPITPVAFVDAGGGGGPAVTTGAVTLQPVAAVDRDDVGAPTVGVAGPQTIVPVAAIDREIVATTGTVDQALDGPVAPLRPVRRRPRPARRLTYAPMLGVVVEDDGQQTLSPFGFVDQGAGGTPTVTGGVTGLAPVALVDASPVGVPTVALVPGDEASGAMLRPVPRRPRRSSHVRPAPVLLSGVSATAEAPAQGLSPVAIVDLDGAGTPTLVAATLLQPASLVDVSPVPDPTLQVGAVTLSPVALVDRDGAGVPSLFVGTLIQSIAAVDRDPIGAPTLQVGPVTLGAVSAVDASPAGRPSLVPILTVVPAPALDANGAGQPRLTLTLQPVPVATDGFVANPVVSAGPVTLSPVGIPHVSALGTPGVFHGQVVYEVAGIGMPQVVGVPVVSREALDEDRIGTLVHHWRVGTLVPVTRRIGALVKEEING